MDYYSSNITMNSLFLIQSLVLLRTSISVSICATLCLSIQSDVKVFVLHSGSLRRTYKRRYEVVHIKVATRLHYRYKEKKKKRVCQNLKGIISICYVR